MGNVCIFQISQVMGQHQSLASDKGTELSLRVAINKLIESCLSNPQSSEGISSNYIMKNEMEDKDKSDEPNSTGDETSSGEKVVESEKTSKLSSDKSFSSAQSFSSLLEMHIRDMIVNCENDEDISKVKEKDTSQEVMANNSVQSSVLSSTSSDGGTSTTTTATVSSAINSSVINSSVTSGLKASGISSVPLQTLVDKVLDNSLGDPSLLRPLDSTNENSKVNGTGDNKSKVSTTYEIAAESAKAVSEKVTRCVEKSQNNNENDGASNPGDICLMAHIEKALERNFAQMSDNENETEIEKNDSSQASVKVGCVQSGSVSRPASSSSSKPNNDGQSKTVGSLLNPRQTLITNPDGTISVQDIVDRIFSQTEMISKLLTPGTPSTTSSIAHPAHPQEKVPPSTPVSSQQSYERSIVKTVNSSRVEPYSHNFSKRHVKQYNDAEHYKVTKHTPSNRSREDIYPSRSTPSSHASDISERQIGYSQVRLKDTNTHHKANSYIQPDISDHYVDPRVINEAQRQAAARENMMMLSRYSYSMPMTSSVDPNSLAAHHLLRCYPPGALMQQRLPPPLLCVDQINDTHIPHPYNKACPCMACSSHRAHMEDLKRSPKQHPSNLLMPSRISPSSSPQYQSRLSPHNRDMRNLSPHSPQRYGNHPSAFTRVKDTLAEREKAQLMYNEELLHQKKNRNDNGIDMMYRERKHVEGFRPVTEPSFHRSKPPISSHSKNAMLPNEVQISAPSYGLNYGTNPVAINQVDQPLDLSKKKPSAQNQQYHDTVKRNIPVYKERDAHPSAPSFSKTNLPDHRFVDQRSIRHVTHHSEHKPFVEVESVSSHEHYLPPHTNISQYQHRVEPNRIQETSAAMTPGMMPDQLGSPGGMRPQLHPLPSPTLSTSYSHGSTSQSPQVPNHIPSPVDKALDVDRGTVVEANISRPSSQCSSSSLDLDKDKRGSISRHEPVQNIIGTHPPSDILYLICRLCRQTYGSPYGFRKHFRNQHGFEPRAEHTIVHTISATKNAMQHIPGMPNIPNDAMQSPRGFQPVPDGTIYDGIDIPKVRERAASDSKLLKPVSMTESIRPMGSRSAESRQVLPCKEETDDTKCLQCEQCKQTFQLNDFGSYKRHCRQHNQTRTIGPFHCQMCSCSFHEPQLLEDHMLQHESETYVCKYCKIPYANKLYLEDHLKTVHGKESVVNVNSCKYCHHNFIDYKELLLHIQSVHGQSGQPDHDKLGVGEKTYESQGDTTVSSHVDIQEADQMTTLSCPDSSSDTLADSARSSVPQSSTGCVTEPVVCNNVKSEELCPSTISNDNSQDDVSSGGNDTNEDSFYKHKKFFGHRKRKESLDLGPIPAKSFKGESAADTVDSNKCDSGVIDNTVSCSSTTNLSEREKLCDSSSLNGDSLPKEGVNMDPLDQTDNLVQNKQEARHQMPFVWDRITRSQAGKNIRPPDYMA
ncbi:hypothetical protein LOTGIDRAFT_156702 [Lottia gigantea]|uniref:C2H2-type domain-containing protein n=1 Tax=Lottia gigantea TaxID=225164 RepID=V4B5D6_LOTGI|nr:hypothetical protein LOTGIDRAFT_156702 [Lottia gigantea]ESP02756.1 hypothetical protein LOTGIDRAFT_156702 [Lottia gigantea]